MREGEKRLAREIAIAIDGPAGAGKSTIARNIAEHLRYVYIDTGAMYRSITLKALWLGLNLENEKELENLVKNTEIDLKPYLDSEGNYSNHIYLDGEEVTDEIRTPKVNQNVSRTSKVVVVRAELVQQQRKMADHGGVVMDGRDIGTIVLPNAQLKIFLTASVEERALRRYRELTEKGYQIDLASLQAEIMLRDKTDMERKTGPLKQAADALKIDTTALTIDDVTKQILKLCQEKIV